MIKVPVHGGVRQMRIIATGLLVVMAISYFTARSFEEFHPAIGFLRAFAEAAMVGGLADWFAVTALFRHPLGLPIPHTAIIPRNKDRIGDTLAVFLRDNFLTPVVVARRMGRLDIAGAAGRVLAAPAAGDGRLRRGASRLLADSLEALDDERLGGMLKGVLVQRIGQLNAAPLLGQLLAAAMKDGRHQPVLDAFIRWGARTLEANRDLIRLIVHERSGTIMRFTGLDETLANKIIDGLDKLLQEAADDPEHRLRTKVEEGLATLAEDLQTDPKMQARVDRIRDEMIANPAMQRWLDGIWQAAREAMLRAARDPQAALAGRMGEVVRQLGETLRDDPALKHVVNRFARRVAVGTAARYGDSIVSLVSETVRSWDARTITGRLENAVGRDLQYIRINGTLVGGLVGLTLHSLGYLF
jgi:Predicted membrane protein